MTFLTAGRFTGDTLRPRGYALPGAFGSFAAVLMVMAVLLVVSACGVRSAPPPPGPGWERGGVPELRGTTVLVLPVQALGVGSPGTVDAELRFALESRGPSVRWMAGAELETLAQQAGRLGADPNALPVAIFEMGEVERVGDPLFGAIYRLGAIADARFAILPVAVRVQASEEDPGRVRAHLNVALLDTRSGRVLWQGILDGAPGEIDSPAILASMAERVAARLLP